MKKVQIEKKKLKRVFLLLTLLIVSTLMALFLPAMITLYLLYPTLVILYLLYLVQKEKSALSITLNVLFIVVGTLITFGVPVILSFMAFIHLYPSYLVLLTTLTLLYMLPIDRSSKWLKGFLFILLSTLLGLNTQLLDLFTQENTKVTTHYSKPLRLQPNAFVALTQNQKLLPTTYHKYDFLSFGANEGCGCGYWTFPKVGSIAITKLLQEQGIAYATEKVSPQRIVVDYVADASHYVLHIELRSHGVVLSSLDIQDKLPFQGIQNIKPKDLEALDYRWEYLLRHNIWNALLVYVSPPTDYTELITRFISKSIRVDAQTSHAQTSPKEINSTLSFSSEKIACSPKADDNYNDYTYLRWSLKHGDTTVTFTPKSLLFSEDNVTYTTKVDTNPYYNAHVPHMAIATDKYRYIVNVLEQKSSILLWKFTKQGTPSRQYLINLPKEVKLKGRRWHPISHFKINDDAISFRVYNIYEASQQKNMCHYDLLHVKVSDL